MKSKFNFNFTVQFSKGISKRGAKIVKYSRVYADCFESKFMIQLKCAWSEKIASIFISIFIKRQIVTGLFTRLEEIYLDEREIFLIKWHVVRW